ncbi:thiamine pyrophosphate-dependent enzyme [Steroidobacter agaridevorans]|uniref:thiamine pyrophosphate-dependent enzyme n=1 Tax=Steroidobacter agaridevorans TaxID=2695856 RepID=UPI0013289963|nr:thiamine pyrophosphate-dependent enzyme [Steroidobacter agaridevorans]GFE86500.1 3-methyl-2-oxobutanoate dehydrogenase (2-methylpropanoyl-transferring) subunit alpha [Steroidobacter agaridevorans]
MLHSTRLDRQAVALRPARNAPLTLRIPEPAARPGEPVNFSKLRLSAPGAVRRPALDAEPRAMHDLAYELIRVLDENGHAVGPWAPEISSATLIAGLRNMMLTRVFDERMYRAQRQGKCSFYVRSTGEEAVAVAQAAALESTDMLFGSYRSQGLLIARGYPLLKMMGQVYSNALDPLLGRQMPVMYSSREHNYFTISGNLGTQFIQAVGWAMGSALSGDTRIAASWIGDGTTAEGDFHYALTFASVYRAPVILNVVNNQWAISSFQGIAGGDEAPFAARAVGYGLPALRVDGNDFLAVYAATKWAAQRARSNHGATLIELFTYRAEAHSTSDDPSRYRPADEGAKWPLGDPIARLKQHLIARGEWSEQKHASLQEEVTAEVRNLQKEAEARGVHGNNHTASPKTMFEGVFKEPDPRLLKQRQEAGF